MKGKEWSVYFSGHFTRVPKIDIRHRKMFESKGSGSRYVSARKSGPSPSSSSGSEETFAALGLLKIAPRALKVGDILDSLPACAKHPPCSDSDCKECIAAENPPPPPVAASHPYPYPYLYPYPPYFSHPTAPKARTLPPGVDSFFAMITPLTNLRATQSDSTGQIEFKIKKKNGTVTLQWESFSGEIAAAGSPFLVVRQSIANLPEKDVVSAYKVVYKGVPGVAFFSVLPAEASGLQLRFGLNVTDNPSLVAIGDSVVVHGGSITWISNDI